MPNWAMWLLIASIFIALIIMLVAWLVTRHKINKIRDDYLATEKDEKEQGPLAIDKRAEFQQELWDLETKATNPMGQHSIEYAMNTAIRNNYKSVLIVGGSKYEKTSFRKLTPLKVSEKDYDYVVIIDIENIDKVFNEYYSALPVGGLIFIANALKKNASIKKLKAQLKTTGIRHEELKIDKGVILVAK